MDVRTTTLEEFLGAVLRGAAKILGCGSTSLIFINENTQQIGIRLGTMAEAGPVVEQVERVLGGKFGKLIYPLHSARDSAAYRVWREKTMLETSSLAEIVGSAFPKVVTATMVRVIGEHRFICVPALSGSRNYGVLLFQKAGSHPFSRQQREVILRYARRIGEILESDLMGQGQQLIAGLPSAGPEYVIFDAQGRPLGQSSAPSLTAEQVQALGLRAQALLAGVFRPTETAPGDLPAEFSVLRLGDGPAVLCKVSRPDPADEPKTLENQLLQVTLADARPSLFVDPQLRITSWNRAAEQSLGWTAADLAGKPLSQLFAVPAQLESLLALEAQSPNSEESATLVRGDDTVAEARVECLTLLSDTRESVGHMVLVRLSEDEPRGAANRLVEKERLATMGELAAQLAHELRNPIVAIGANLESLVRDPELSEDHRSVLSAVRREVVRMDMLLKDHLAARHDLSFAEVDVGEALAEAAGVLEGAFRSAGKSLSVRCAPGLRTLGDHDALKHVLFNLLLNALEASPSGGEVTCSASADERTVTLAIEDRGPGLAVPAEELFRPFFTTKKNGTGLGLTVCRKITKAHGGAMTLANREGGGCRATVVLPRRRAAGNGASA